MKFKYNIIKICCTILFVLVAYFACKTAPYYIDNDNYGGRIRLVIDDRERTSELPNNIIIADNEVLFSLETAKKFIDPYINFSSDTIKINHGKYIIQMPINENIVKINLDEISINAGVRNIEEVTYLPIKILEDVYGMSVVYNDKVVITTELSGDFNNATLAKNVNLKKYERSLCRTVSKLKKGENIAIITPDFEKLSDDKYVFVRSSKGDLGYIKKSKLKLEKIENEVRLDGINISMRMPDDAIIEKGKVMLSFDTVKKFIDKYIYFDKENETIIAINESNIVKFRLNENTINFNDMQKTIDVPAKIINEKIYLPFEEIADIYNMELNNSNGINITQKISNEEKVSMKNEKISLVWEYAEFSSKDRTGEEQIKGLNVVSPTWIFLANTNGDIKDSIDSKYISWARKNSYEIWPTIKNDRFTLEDTSKIVTDMNVRKKLIDKIVEICEKNKFEGINLDFEHMYQRDREEYVIFVRELAAKLKTIGATTSVAVNIPDGSSEWSLCFDNKGISDSCDYITVMTYDQYGVSSKVPGPVAGLNWVELNLKKMIERDKIDNNKIILGVPFYSRYWRVKDGEVKVVESLTMSNAKRHITNNPKQTVWDEELGQNIVKYELNGSDITVYVEDEKSLEKKMELVEKYNLPGVAAWRRDYETNDVWGVIADYIK